MFHFSKEVYTEFLNSDQDCEQSGERSDSDWISRNVLAISETALEA